MAAAENEDGTEDGISEVTAPQSSLADRAVLDRVEKLEKEVSGGGGLAGWAKRWAPLLAIIAAVFAVPKGIVDLYKAIVTSPALNVTAGPEVVVMYNPKAVVLHIRAQLSLENSGTASETIESTSAHLQVRGASGVVPFPNGSVRLIDQEVPVIFPLVAAAGAPRTLTLTASTPLGSISRSTFDRVGWHVFVAELHGKKNGTYRAQYCFPLTAISMARLSQPGEIQRGVRFLSQCDLMARMEGEK